MTPLDAVLLVFAAGLGGALNAVAGGGSFFTFPSLLLAGVPAIHANATSAVALWPGSVAAVGGYRGHLTQERRALLVLAAASLAGGLLGALILLQTPERTFARLVPFLLLAATLVLALGPRLARRASLLAPGRVATTRTLVALAVTQLVVATYGGYFGGGIGILMLAAFTLAGMTDVHAMNGLKALLAVAINGVAIVAFALAGIVEWPLAVLMALGAAGGGYGGARVARLVDPMHVRRFVVAVGFALSAYFFVRGA